MGRAPNTSSPWTELTHLGLRREEPSNLTTSDQRAALITCLGGELDYQVCLH